MIVAKDESDFRKLLEPYLISKKMTHAWGSVGRLQEVTTALFTVSEPQGNYIFDLASLTKVLVTLPLWLSEIFRGSLPLDMTLGAWLGAQEELFTPNLRNLPLAFLFRHCAGLPAWRNFWMNRLVKPPVSEAEQHSFVIEKLNRLSSDISLNSGYVYSDVGFILLGVLLELRKKRTLSCLFDEYCGTELGVSFPCLGFGDKIRQVDRKFIVPTSYCPIRQRILCGEVHDENAAALNGIAGHAGLFGDGESMGRFLTSFFCSDVGKGLLDRNVKLAETEASVNLYGWRRREFSFLKGELVFEHLGFTGTGVWLFPRSGLYIIFLTNRVVSSRTSQWIQPLREQVCAFLAERFI